MAESTHYVTQLLGKVRQGDSAAEHALLDALYTELHRLAEIKMRQEKADCLMQPTMLIHEAYLKIFAGQEKPSFPDRRDLLKAMARAMRQVLVDYARRRRAKKRSAEGTRQDEREIALASRYEEILNVHEALERLAQEDPQTAELVTLRFFGGYSMQEVAEILGISLRTAQRSWAFAQAKLKQWLERPS